jgi:signal transduction histidine kinase/CheY-like chemotaxis protein
MNNSSPIQDETLAELRRHEAVVSHTTTVSQVLRALTENPMWPGVVVLEGSRVVGVVARSRIEREVCRTYFRELWGRRAVSERRVGLVRTCEALTVRTTVHDALSCALARPLDEAYDPLLCETGALGGGWSLVNLHDVLVAHNRSLHEQKTRSESASRARAQYFACMTHEVRTPVTAILGYADLLGDPGVGEEQRVQYSSVIRRSAEHLLALVNDVLYVSKLESGVLELEQIEMDPGRLVRDAVELLEPRARAAGVELRCDVRLGELERMVGDPTRVRQVLINLVGNAIKFTPSGSVTVRAQAQDGAGEDGLVGLELSVVDTGIGMTAEQAQRAFTPYAQGDASVARTHGGTGLGLSICRSLVGLMGGTLTVQTAPGAGSTFTVNLRVKAVRGVSVPVVSGVGGRRVLLVEDSADSQRLLVHVLRRGSFTVQVAGDGRQAIEAIGRAMLEGAAPDAVLMDVHMPVIGGPQAIAQVRALGYTGPILALTASASGADHRDSLEAGANDVLTKPIAREALLRALEAWIARMPVAQENGQASGQVVKPAA